MTDKTVLLVGAGSMAIEYAKILKALKKEIIVVGRSEKSAKKFEEETSIRVETGGIEKYLHSDPKLSYFAIVATTGTELGRVTRLLLKAGIKTILLEKPGGIDPQDIKLVEKVAIQEKAQVFLAYNRRFYSSTIKAMEIIKEDGGVSSFTFEFTEWSHIIQKLTSPSEIKKHWLLHNSTHVIDLAFFLGGIPEKLECFSTGGLHWHPSGAIFVGAGKSITGALFSYHANWAAPGRWWVEIMTNKHRLIFRPMEKLSIQNIGSVAIESVSIDDHLDIEFKPGLYKQVQSFLIGDYSNLKSISDHVKSLDFYLRINGLSID